MKARIAALEKQNEGLRELVKEAFGIMDSRGYAKEWVVKAVDALAEGE